MSSSAKRQCEPCSYLCRRARERWNGRVVDLQRAQLGVVPPAGPRLGFGRIVGSEIMVWLKFDDAWPRDDSKTRLQQVSLNTRVTIYDNARDLSR